MPVDAQVYLADMTVAADKISAFTVGKTYEDYLANDLLRSGVENWLVWGIVESKLPDLRASVVSLVRGGSSC